MRHHWTAIQQPLTSPARSWEELGRVVFPLTLAAGLSGLEGNLLAGDSYT